MKNRKPNRMIGFDYSKDAIYFVTSCCQNRIHHFGEVINGEMKLNQYGHIAHNQILWLETQYPYVELHNFVVMPNHIHLLFEINRNKISTVGTVATHYLYGQVATHHLYGQVATHHLYGQVATCPFRIRNYRRQK